MQGIKFVSKDKVQFASALRKNVNEYFKSQGISQKGNIHMTIKSIVMLSLYLVPFVIILTLPISSWLILPLGLIMGIGMAGTGMSVMHDAMHGSFSRKNWLNKLLSNTMYMLGGNIFTWKVQHNILHHTYTNINGFDEDIKSKSILRFSKHAPLKRIHRFQHIYAIFFYSLMTISKLFRDFFQLHEYNKAGITRAQKATPGMEYTKMVASKVLYLFIIIGLPLLLTGFSWWLIISWFVIMHLVAGVIMSIVFQLAHVVEGPEQPLPNTEGNIENEWVIHELLTTSNFSPNSRILNWFIGGLNFQIEHHLFPNICHIHYKNISPIVEKTALEFGLKYNRQPTFRKAIRSHIRTLKSFGRQAA